MGGTWMENDENPLVCLDVFGYIWTNPESQFFVANFRANDGEPSTAGAFNFPYLFYWDDDPQCR